MEILHGKPTNFPQRCNAHKIIAGVGRDRVAKGAKFPSIAEPASPGMFFSTLVPLKTLRRLSPSTPACKTLRKQNGTRKTKKDEGYETRDFEQVRRGLL
jgi:hypothetical protein